VLSDDPVRAICTLVKPVVGVPHGTRTTTTIPIGAEVEFFQTPHRVGLIQVRWEGRSYAVFLHDLLDACTPGDVGGIGWP
jgi:hypothetical protein